jgi:hypothetical protein
LFAEQYARHVYSSFAAGKLHWTKLWAFVVLGWYLQRNDVVSVAELPKRPIAFA